MILKILLSIVIFMASCAGWADFPTFVPVNTPEKGVGDWEKVPFGEMRLVSCTTGVKDLGVIVGGLQIRLNPDWTLKRPTLKPLIDTYPTWIEPPVRSGSGRNTQYQKEVFIPVVYTKNPADKADFEYGVQGIFPACQGDICMDLPIKMTMNLSATENDYTSMCAYILDKKNEAPMPATLHSVRGFAIQENEGIRLAFVGLEDARIAFLQTVNQDDFVVPETQLEKTGLFMRIKTDAWPLNTSKEWILITNKGVFKVPVLMQKNLPTLLAKSAPFSIWWMGWELFFLTPLFIWWGLGVNKTKKQWQKQIRRLMIALPFVFVLWSIRQYFELSLGIYYALFLWGLVCLFPPKKGWVALSLFLLWPSVIQLPQVSIDMLILWGLAMMIEIELPFLFLYLKADEIGKVLRDYKKKKFFLFNLTFLIPTLGLLIIGICNLTKAPIYQNTLNPDGISIVCEKCTPWQKLGNTHFITPKSILGNTLHNIYNRSKEVIIWQEKGERVILPPDISLRQTERFIKNWQTYHALYTP